MSKQIRLQNNLNKNNKVETINNNKNVYSQFANVNTPSNYQAEYKNSDNYVWYGQDNLYPDWLLYLYANSPSHSSIINAKSNYILGAGIADNDGNKIDDIKVNSTDTLSELVSKITKDFLLFNYFGIEVVYNALNQPIFYNYIPANWIRTNINKDKFFVTKSWKLRNFDIIEYNRYSDNFTDNKSKLFFYDGYFPSIYNTYSQPEYLGGVKAIQTDIAIREFNLNQIKNDFSPSHLITFFNGANLPEEVKGQIISTIKSNYTGENGNKFIFDFQTIEGKQAQIQDLSPTGWEDAYIALATNTTNDIMISHSVTSPMLFGLKTEGQLGGSTELETAFQIFKSNYIEVKRAEILNGLQLLFKSNDNIPSFKFIDKSLFVQELSDDTKKYVYTVNELRELQGLEKLSDERGNKLLIELDKIDSNTTTNSNDNSFINDINQNLKKKVI